MTRGRTALGALLLAAALGSGGIALGQVAAPGGGSAPKPLVPTPSPFPQFEVVSGALDLGYVKPKSYPSKVMTLVNQGTVPLKITKAKGDCACVTATPNKETVAPGEGVDILVGMEAPAAVGVIQRTVEVYCEGFEEPFRAPAWVEAGYAVRVNGGGRTAIIVDRRGKVTLDSIDGKLFRVLAIDGRAPTFLNYDPATEGPRNQYVAVYDWSKVPNPDLPRWLIIETDHPDAKMVDVPAMVPGYTPLVDSSSRWRPLETKLVLGQIPADAPSASSVVLSGRPVKEGMAITTSSSNPDVMVEIVGVKRPAYGGGIEAALRVTPRQGFTGFMHSVIGFKMEMDETSLDLYARVGGAEAPADAVKKN